MAGPLIRGAFNGPEDEFNRSGKRPVVFDLLGPDRVHSVLPDGLRLVLHVNPQSMQWSYQKTIGRTQTLGGWLETHWGANPTEINFNAVTGGFVRLYSGLSNITGPGPSNRLVQPNMQAQTVGGTRRDTIAYDRFLDLLALYKNNGSIYDTYGNIALQGSVLMAYDGGAWNGWFTTFHVEEAAEKPYQFSLTAAFTVDQEHLRLRTVRTVRPTVPSTAGPVAPVPTPAPTPAEPPRPFEPAAPATADATVLSRL